MHASKQVFELGVRTSRSLLWRVWYTVGIDFRRFRTQGFRFAD